MLPGENSIEASGRLTRGKFGPVFAGPVKIAGAGLRPLTRWAAGDRDVSGQASVGDFSFMANASIGDGELNLADATGELSGTKFNGDLRVHGGERPLIELNLDSDRLDLREVMGEGSLWQFWMPAAAASGASAADKSLFAELPDNDMRVTLRVGELLLPNIPPGKLDARFALQGGTLDVRATRFCRIERAGVERQGPHRAVCATSPRAASISACKPPMPTACASSPTCSACPKASAGRCICRRSRR